MPAETPHSFSHLESPSTGATLPLGQHRFSGWVWSKAGSPFVDVRARVGEEIFPGIHGIPRADLADHFKTGRPYALAEFYIIVDLPIGTPEVALEHLSIDGHWRPFDTATFHVTKSIPPIHIPTPETPLRWHEYGRALQMLLRKQRAHPALSVDQLAHELVAQIPSPRDLRHPHHPFHGHLDEPAAITRCRYARSPVLGYLFHETLPIKRVLATFDLQVWQTIEHTKPSATVGEHFSQFENARNAGFFGIIDVPTQLPSPLTLRLYAELEDGSLHLCSVARSHLFTDEEEKKPYPPHDLCSFDETNAALNRAIQPIGLDPSTEQELETELKRLREDFERQSPATLSRPSRPPTELISPATTPFPKRILLVTHNLNLEGAPLFLIDLAQHYISLGAELTILSPSDGALRERFEHLGAKINICDLQTLFSLDNRSLINQELEKIEHTIDFAAYELVVCNTFTTFWAVHIAKLKSLPVLLYVHESTTPIVFYGDRVPPAIVDLAIESFRLADTITFTTASTRNYHCDYGDTANYVVTPGWIHIPPIDEFLKKTSRQKIRETFGISSGDLLVTNIGTVSDRKGQHTFVRAVDLFCRRHPDLAKKTKFIMLGARDGVFNDMLISLLSEVNLPNIELHPETTEYLRYYTAADLTVCTSHEESSPRIVMEAMACGTPLLSTNVQGIPELVRPDLEATLISAGDSFACCEQMAHLLRNPTISKTLAQRARARVVEHFSAERLLPKHSQLAQVLHSMLTSSSSTQSRA